MTDLVVVASSGKGTWGHVYRLIREETWDKIFVVTNEFGVANFKPEKDVEFIKVDNRKSIIELTTDIQNALLGKIRGLEVAVNIVSGEGKEHMALLSAILKLGVGLRFVALTVDGIKEI